MAQSKASSIGWMFVPQYYTFVNKDPERLHCFYTKRSTLIHGVEGEDCTPCYGQQEIHEKIMQIGFDDCKVFVSNVDSQGSAENGIVVQVIGELSNKGGPWRKFAQTFFLAEQPNGYFVLNDIFRYIKEESDDDHEAATADAVEPSSAPSQTNAESDFVEQQNSSFTAAPIQDVNLSDVHGPASTAAAVTVSHAAEPSSQHATLENTVNGTEQQVVELHDEISSQPTFIDAPVVEATPPASETQVNGGHDAETKQELPETQVEEASSVTPESAPIAPVPVSQGDAPSAPSKEQPVASTSQTAPSSQSTPPPAPKSSGPPVPKTWANLAAAGSNKWKTQVMSATQGVSSTGTSGTSSPVAGTFNAGGTGQGASSSATPAASASGSGFQGSSGYPTGPGHETGHSIIVRGVTQDMSHNILRRRFGDLFGKSSSAQPNRREAARIPYIHIDRSEGIAYMDFEHEKAMEQAIKKGSAELDGTQLKLEDGRGVAKPSYSGGGGGDRQGGGRGRGGDGKPKTPRSGKDGASGPSNQSAGSGRGRGGAGQQKPSTGGGRQ